MTSPAIGIGEQFALDCTAESSYGTAATTPDKSWPIRMDQPQIVTETVDDTDSQIGAYGAGLTSVPVKQHAVLAGDMDLRVDALATLAKFIFGKLASSGGPSYTHTITQETDAAPTFTKSSTVPSFTGYWTDAKSTATKSNRYTGCVLESVTIRGAIGGKLVLAFNAIGCGTVTEQVVSMPSLNSDAYALFAGVSTFTIGGADYMPALRDFEITIRNILDPSNHYKAGGIVLTECPRTGFGIEGKFNLDYAETVLTGLQAYVSAQTTKAIILAGAQGTNTFTATIRNAFLQDGRPTGGRSEKVIPVTFRSFYDTSNSEVGRLVVVNGVAAYT